jgi:hypothetical protein
MFETLNISRIRPGKSLYFLKRDQQLVVGHSGRKGEP